MIPLPDAERQYCIKLSHAIKRGDDLFDELNKDIWLFTKSTQDRAQDAEEHWARWWHETLRWTTPAERSKLEEIRAKPSSPTWDQAWASLTGRSEQRWPHKRGGSFKPALRRQSRERSKHHRLSSTGGEHSSGQVILYWFQRMLDELKARRLRLFPPSPVSADLRLCFAESFHGMGDGAINKLFLENGCVLDLWVTPRRPTGKQSADCVLGWVDGLILHRPDEVVVIMQEAYQSYRRYKKIPRDVPPADIELELAALLEPPAPALLASYQLHPRVVQTATPFWVIREYETALFKVCIALDNEVQAKSGNTNTGTKLMQQVFSDTNPMLKVDQRFGNQHGFMYLFTGAMDALRNPGAHHFKTRLSEQEALEWLAFLSALFRVLDAATV